MHQITSKPQAGARKGGAKAAEGMKRLPLAFPLTPTSNLGGFWFLLLLFLKLKVKPRKLWIRVWRGSSGKFSLGSFVWRLAGEQPGRGAQLAERAGQVLSPGRPEEEGIRPVDGKAQRARRAEGGGEGRAAA